MNFLGKDSSKDSWLLKILVLAAISGSAFFYLSDVSVSDVFGMLV